MQALKQMGGGFLLAALSLLVVIGGISLALAEGTQSVFDAPGGMPTDEIAFATEDLGDLSFLLTLWPSDTPTVTGATSAALPSPTALFPTDLSPTALISFTLTPTRTLIPCGAPYGWIQYTIQPGDTLYHISVLYRTSVSELQRANCLGSSTAIYTGQKLWVPNVATSTPPATPIEIIFDTETPTPSDTPTPTSTNTDVPTPTGTATPTPSPTSTPTGTTPT